MPIDRPLHDLFEAQAASTPDAIAVEYAGARLTYAQIDAQADATAGLINWGSPLGRALLGAQLGDEVLWQRPAGDQLIEITRIEPA